MMKNFGRLILSIIANVVIAVTAAFIDSNGNIKRNLVLIIILMIFFTIDAFVSYNIRVSDRKDRQNIEAYRGLNDELVRQMNKEAEGINAIAKSIIQYGTIPGNRWTFEKEAIELCHSLYKYLVNRTGKNSGIKVLYCKREDNEIDIIRTIGYASGRTEFPHNFRTRRNINDSDAYCDARLFVENSSHAFFRLSSEAVDNVLYYKDRERESGQYEQCLFIPVMCEQTKMIGLIEIFTYKGQFIARNNDEMDRLIIDLGIFSAVFLLLQKTDKAACAIPIEIVGETEKHE